MNLESINLIVGRGDEQRSIAVLRREGGSPGLFWLGGYRSDMHGTKAETVGEYGGERSLAVTRFDYSGHGQSGGKFEDGTVSRWLEEAQVIFETTAGAQIVIGSSMGGWLALLLADLLRQQAQNNRVAGLVLIAPAVDMTKALMWDVMSTPARRELISKGIFYEPSRYSDEPTPITKKLIDDGEKHLFGDRLIVTGCPVHILQGMEDDEVPYAHASALVERLASDDVVLTLVKDGDHRLSQPEDLYRLREAMAAMIDGD